MAQARAKLEESETALALAKAKLKEREAALALANVRIKEREAALAFANEYDSEATCPVCGKTFSQGGFHPHPASQKLWQHMGHFHLTARQKLSWDMVDWQPGLFST